MRNVAGRLLLDSYERHSWLTQNGSHVAAHPLHGDGNRPGCGAEGASFLQHLAPHHGIAFAEMGTE